MACKNSMLQGTKLVIQELSIIFCYFCISFAECYEWLFYCIIFGHHFWVFESWLRFHPWARVNARCSSVLLFLISLPMLGAASPEAVRKLMSLTDKVRPHNPKHPMPPVGSPFQGRRPTSPRYSNSRPLAVHLSPESSSVVSLSNLGFRKPSRTGKQSCGHCLVSLAWVLVEVGISVVCCLCAVVPNPNLILVHADLSTP